MWRLNFLIKIIICTSLGTLACVPALLLLLNSGIIGDNVCSSVFYTPAKANVSAHLAKSIPYTWISCEERKWDVVKERVSMDCTNDVITLGESEVHAWHGHPTPT